MLHFLYTVQVKIHTKQYCMKPEMMGQWPLLSSEIYPTTLFFRYYQVSPIMSFLCVLHKNSYHLNNFFTTYYPSLFKLFFHLMSGREDVAADLLMVGN